MTWTTIPASGYITDTTSPAPSADGVGGGTQWFEDLRNTLAQMHGAAAEASVTISSDAITIAQSANVVDTEGGASSDNLSAISQTNIPDGTLAVLCSTSSGRVITVKNNVGGTGKILLADSADLALTDPSIFLCLVKRGTTWVELWRFYGNAKSGHRAYWGLAIGTDVQAYDVDTAKLDVVQTWTAKQTHSAAVVGTVATLTDGATVTPDMATANCFSWTIGGNRTLANPTNQVAGQGFVIVITQDGTGGRTITFGSAYEFEGDVAPSLSTAIGAKDYLIGYVDSSGHIGCQLLKDMR